MTTWNETTPAGTSSISGGDDAIREMKSAVRERLAREHYWPSSGDATSHGEHRFDNGNYADCPAADAANAGKLFLATDVKTLMLDYGGAWLELPFAAGTKAVFNQATAPLGWTKDTDVDDKVMIIHSGTNGGSTGGAWAISGLTTTIAAHYHTVNLSTGYPSDTNYNQGGAPNIYCASSTHLHTVSGNTGTPSDTTGTTAGDGVWRPAYQYVIKCEKD